MKRWIALVLGIIALAAGFAQLRSMARDAQPTESISDQSRAQLDDVVRRTASGEVHEAASENHR